MKYSIGQILDLSWYVVKTKILFCNARLIRFPVDIRNKRHIKVGHGFTTGKYCRLEAYPNPDHRYSIRIGQDVQINDSVHIVGSVGVTIGNSVLIASKVFISDLNHGSYGSNDIHDSPLISPSKRGLMAKPVNIEDNVWIGEFVSVLPGVTIGKGSIIGTMSVVTKSIPAYSIAVGAPARIIKKYNFDSKRWEKV